MSETVKVRIGLVIPVTVELEASWDSNDDTADVKHVRIPEQVIDADELFEHLDDEDKDALDDQVQTEWRVR